MKNCIDTPDFHAFSFPLNVYALALFLEEGKTEYLHYGLFQNSNTSLHDAQLYSTNLVLSQLPEPPCKILEIGVGLGTTLKLLTKMGYQCHGISPDVEQINYIQEHWNGSAPITCQSLEDFFAEHNSFDVILFQESAQYIDPLVIFNKALDYLKTSGSLLILDEVALKPCGSELENLHLVNDIFALAERFNFTLIDHHDLSKLAAPTLDYLLNITHKHRDQLINDLSLSIESLDQLDVSNATYREKYLSGHYGYALLHFKKQSIPKWRLKSPCQQDIKEIQALFKLSFNHSISINLLQWKYADKNSQQLCIWHNNQLVAHYGGMPREVLFFGEPQSAIQVGDVMLNPYYRGISTQKGPFFKMAATFLERYIGYGKPFQLGFGFPNNRAMKVAEHLKLYAEVDKMCEITWPACSSRPHLLTCLREINHDNIEHYAANIDQLWQFMRQDLKNSIIGIRDYNYILSRYLNHPEHSYQIVAIKSRFSQKLQGILILKNTKLRFEIIDIISSIKHIPLLIHQAQRLSNLHSHKQLHCLITAGFATLFESNQSHCELTDIRIPANIWSAGPEIERIKNHWWLMSGDMDCR